MTAPADPLPPAAKPEYIRALTEGVSVLTGDPKTAIRKLSVPMMAAMLFMSVYNLINAIWVAGLGPDALAAVGFMTPVFMIFIGLGNGLGAGVSSVVSRRIGGENRQGAESAAMHGLLMGAAIALVLTAPLVLFAEPIAVILGAGSVAPLAAEYGRILFIGAIFILFNNIAYAILRGEGDTKRTMYAMAFSSILNAILDPILIYWAGFGIAGAAIATVISIVSVTLVILYWFLIRKDTYLSITMRGFVPDRKISRDILGVGLPASIEYLLMATLSIVINAILVIVSGTDAVAVYTSGWRLLMFAVIPDIAIATTLISVIGAAYGARKYGNLTIAHGYAIRLGIMIAAGMAAFIFVFAPQIAILFTYSESTAYLAPRIASFLRVISLLLIFIPPGMMSLSVFQGTGRGFTSLVINILRSLAFVAVCVVLFGIVLGYGETGVWFGIVLGNILGSMVAYLWARIYINRLRALEENAT
ncbi:MAG: MATE family efflux transporter [Methanoregulaceae archaeon]|jgi:putative MATE family efflux protein|nr:MATE family efflux transporter [Methanoregulaceae archaeon]MCU0628054.1 MATE family efflux transporter [Methanoregulaceae archaeon]